MYGHWKIHSEQKMIIQKEMRALLTENCQCMKKQNNGRREPTKIRHSCASVGSNPVFGITKHKPTVNSAVHPSEVGKWVLRSNSEGTST